jgi:uncharacterized protein (DUF433 family)
MPVLTKTEHPHVQQDKHGRAVVGKSQMDVHILAEYWRLGWTIDELKTGYPYLSRGEILDALSYAEDHAEQIEKLISANRPPTSDPDA